ncbi:MAG: helix-turn-helix domain-containing protein [Candidatus Staskawiczbacteria bacterium]|nr:helix-turn-helix domain-containing protein [Candidatus Staskawiczbacteria bacterium]MBI3337259.1 helix-turn-helix domain-containing protein [Candidatus Staskawiczbacteria bacterium]
MTDEIKPGKIYTPKEARDFLKISESTMKRMIKGGIINTYKVSGQYRIWGREILRLVSPETMGKGDRVYLTIKERVKNAIKKW